MALKTLMLRRQIDLKKKALCELNDKLSGFASREAELEQAIAEVETDEQRTAVEEEITAFETERSDAQTAADQLTEEIRSHPDKLYVMDAAVLSHQFYFGTPASRVLTTDLFGNVVRSGSWDSYSPRYYSQLEGCLDDPDNLLTAVVEDPDVMYVSMGGCSDIAALYENRTGNAVSFEGREFPGRGITVWSLGKS